MASSRFPDAGSASTVVTASPVVGDGSSGDPVSLNSSLLTAGGATTQVQFNDGGAFAGDADLAWDKTNNVLTVIGNSSAGGNGPGLFKGSGVTFGSDFVGLTVLDTEFSATSRQGFHLGQYANGDGYLYVGDYGTEIDFTQGGDVHIFSTTLTFLGTASRFHFASVMTSSDSNPTLLSEGDVNSANTTDEPSNYVSSLSVNIGTGFSQTTNAPRAWYRDESMQGPIATQPHLLNGATLLINNHYNGDAADSPMVGLALTTLKGSGHNVNGTMAVADTFPIAYGLLITGFSHASAADGIGYTTAIKLGGTISTGWNEGKGLIGTGIDISSYSTRGLYIHAPTGSPTASIDADGLIKGGSFAVGATAGIDTTITTASLVGKTITVTKGLITGFA